MAGLIDALSLKSRPLRSVLAATILAVPVALAAQGAGSGVRPGAIVPASPTPIAGGASSRKVKTRTIDFTAPVSTWSKQPLGGNSLQLRGIEVVAAGGNLSQFGGLSIMSPSDTEAAGWTKEIDAYNDSQESISLRFVVPQRSVSIGIQQSYRERLYTSASTAEKTLVDVTFTDGTSTLLTIGGVQTERGEVVIDLDSSAFGGKLIASVSLAPSLDVPPDVPPENKDDYNATHPYSDFTLKSVTFSVKRNRPPGK